MLHYDCTSGNQKILSNKHCLINIFHVQWSHLYWQKGKDGQRLWIKPSLSFVENRCVKGPATERYGALPPSRGHLMSLQWNRELKHILAFESPFSMYVFSNVIWAENPFGAYLLIANSNKEMHSQTVSRRKKEAHMYQREPNSIQIFYCPAVICCPSGAFWIKLRRILHELINQSLARQSVPEAMVSPLPIPVWNQ